MQLTEYARVRGRSEERKISTCADSTMLMSVVVQLQLPHLPGAWERIT